MAEEGKDDTFERLSDILGEKNQEWRKAFDLPKKEEREEKGLPWRAKVIDGEYYIPLSQVAELLEQNGVLPKVTEGIKRRVQKGPPNFSRKAGHENMNDQ